MWCKGDFLTRRPPHGHLATGALCWPEAVERLEDAGWVLLSETRHTLQAVCPECWLIRIVRLDTRIERLFRRDDEVEDSDLAWSVSCC